MTITIQTERFPDAWQDLQPLLLRHWDEIALKDMCGPLDINEDAYRRLDAAGILALTVVRDEGHAIGYAAYFIIPNLHYRHLVMAEPDVFFLAPEHRKGTTGLRLLKAAEASLIERGVTTIVQRVKTAHDCGAIFKRMGYAHVENVWMKAVG